MRKVNAFLLTIGFIFLFDDRTAWGQKEGGKEHMSFN